MDRINKLIGNLDFDIAGEEQRKEASKADAPKKLVGALELRIAELKAVRSTVNLAYDKKEGNSADLAKAAKDACDSFSAAAGDVKRALDMLDDGEEEQEEPNGAEPVGVDGNAD